MSALCLLVCSAAGVSCDRQWLTSFLSKLCLFCSYQIVKVEMYHIFWGKSVLFEGDRVEKYTDGKMEHFSSSPFSDGGQ